MAVRIPRVVVVGPTYVDMTVRCGRIPEAGQTVTGSGFSCTATGAGLNQAVQAAFCGCQVHLISKVCNDIFGQVVKENLADFDVNTDLLCTAEAKNTGIIVTLVNSEGENSSCIAEGANRALRPQDIECDASEQTISSADVVLIHGQLPADAVSAAIKMANLHRKKVILDPAAVALTAEVPIEFFSVNILIPDLHEAAEIADVAAENIHETKMIGSDLVARGVESVVIKMGRKGCLVIDRNGAKHFPAFSVELVDQTCSGDAFAGALAASVAVGDNIEQAVKFASAAGALACTRFGAQDSLPKKEEIIQLLQQQSD
jgi:ribokinase